MQELNYDSLSERLKQYSSDKIYVTNIIKDGVIAKRLLKIILNKDIKEDVSECTIVDTIDARIVNYVSKDLEKDKKKNGTIYLKNGMPYFLMEYYENNFYTEEKYATFVENINRIDKKIEIETYQIDEVVNKRIRMLILNDKEYTMLKYNINIKDGEIISIEDGKEVYTIGNNSFSLRSATLVKTINKVEEDIKNKIEHCLESNVKVYKINRKKQEL